MSALRSPTGPPLQRFSTSHLSPRKVSSKRAQRHFVSPRATGGMFPLHFAKIISPCTHLVIPFLFLQPVLVIVPPQYGDMAIRGIEGNA